MRIYVAMVADRHTDTEAYPFSTAEAAITYAQSEATDLGLVEEPVKGWLYHAAHPTESDSVWVDEKELDNPN